MPALPEPDGLPESLAELEAAVDGVIADCEGNARAAVRVLVVAVSHLEAELQVERARIASLARLRHLERAEAPLPYRPG